jgi:hypothetical protein
MLVRAARLSRPLESKPKIVRTATGLIGINTLLLAGAVWGYVALRPRHVPAAQAFDLNSAVLPQPAVVPEPVPAPHAEAGEEEGKHEAGGAKSKAASKSAPKASKKPPAKKPPAKPEEHE